MTPSEYKARYDNVPVALEDGTTATVHVNRYRLGGSNFNALAFSQFESKLGQHGIDDVLEIVTDSGTVYVDPALSKRESDFKRRTGVDVTMMEMNSRGVVVKVDTHAVNWLRMVRSAFLGKGSPEACQVALQLARRWGLAPNLQAYADSCLGLDCNGFVGNYLWHAKNGKPWTELGLDDTDLGANATITQFLPDKLCLSAWDDLDTSKSHVMGMVNGNGQVIPGGAAGYGHIVITEPGESDIRFEKDGSPTFAVWAVESTAGHTPEGLWEGWYSCRNSDAVQNKVFQMDRETMNVAGSRNVSFKIAPIESLGPTP